MIAILHADKEWGIGKKNDLMFSLPTDMKFFRETTTGKVVCMGYNTLLSFPNSKPLKNRINIVLEPDGVERDDCIIVHTLEQLSSELAKYDTEQVFVIGGAMFYRTMLPYCSEVLVTKVEADGGAEVFYENLDALPNWSCIDQGEPIQSNGLTIRFTVYKNSQVKQF